MSLKSWSIELISSNMESRSKHRPQSGNDKRVAIASIHALRNILSYT